jgi:hypothetical protein
MRDESTYGFNKADAAALLEKIEMRDELSQPTRRRGRAGSGGCILIKTPGGGIAACTGTGPYTFGSATCTIVSDAGVVGTDTVTVKNIVSVAIPANVIGKAEKVGSIWVIDVASCGA